MIAHPSDDLAARSNVLFCRRLSQVPKPTVVKTKSAPALPGAGFIHVPLIQADGTIRYCIWDLSA